MRRSPPARPGGPASPPRSHYLRPGDTLCVWKRDRLSRSVKDVLIIADDLHEQGTGLRVLTGKLAGASARAGKASSSSP